MKGKLSPAKKYYIKVTGKGIYHVRLMSVNTNISMASQIYYNKSNAQRAAKQFAEDFGLEVK